MEKAIKKGFEELANAIVLQACVDYQDLRGKNTQQDIVRRQSIIDFFHSELFGMITDISPEALIKRLEKGDRIKNPEDKQERCEVA